MCSNKNYDLIIYGGNPMAIQTAALQKHTLYLNGLNCAHCASVIEEKLQKDQHLSQVIFNFTTKKLLFHSSYNPSDALEHIQQVVDSIEDGVTVSQNLADNHTPNCTDNACSTPSDHSPTHTTTSNPSKGIMNLFQKHALEISGTLILIGLVIYGQTTLIMLPLFLLSYLLIGGQVVLRAFKNILKGRVFDEYFLMTLATIGAFVLGEYVEAAAVMFFYKLGESFQDYAVDKSRSNIKSLLDIKANYANLVQNNAVEQVTPESLKLDDIILIKPGEKVPVDSIVVDGQSSMNKSALTGESIPVPVSVGEALLSGSINIEGTLHAKVTKTYENSTVAKILELVENAAGKKARTEQFITKFAKYYTPFVVVSALLLAFLPPLLGAGDIKDWVSRALIFLVISCPCALVLSVPLGFFGGIGSASRHGILVKGGNYLEALNNIDTFVFDKTGTLTEGKFSVQYITDTNTLSLAAQLEIHSNHPIAKSIVDYYGQEVSTASATQVKEIPGEGLTGLYNHQQLIVGNQRLMERYQIPYAQANQDKEQIGSIVHVALDSNYIGYILINDTIKESSIDTIKILHEDPKSHIALLTGDNQVIAKDISRKLGIEDCHSELLPQDKLSVIESMKETHRKVLFMGDGINDAPVLMRADVGVAMGGLGSDAAIEAADIILMTDEPGKLIKAKEIAKKTRHIVIQNIVFALGIKLLFLSLGALGEASMYEAIFADVGVALLAVLNSMRTLRL
jgi:Cd2+/Zn2+-exporting ATPase